MSTLPKRNPILLGGYGLALIGMFGFLTWQSLPYDATGASYFAQDAQATTPAQAPNRTAEPVNSNTAGTVATAVAPSAVKPARIAASPVPQSDNQSAAPSDRNIVKEYGRTVGGITRTLSLNTELNSQINAHWQTFANSPLANDLQRNRNQVFAVYHGYNDQRNTVELTLGYISYGDRQYASSVNIVTGRYLKRPEKTVLGSWQTADQLPGQLRYITDYEIYQLDQYFQPVSQTAFLALK